MLSRSNWLILALAVLAAAIGGYVARHGQPTPVDNTTTTSLIGQPLPAISLPGLDGRQHALRDYRGRRMLLNFWASWCRPCLEEMPALNEAQANFGENATIILSIAMDEPDHVQAFLAAHPVNYPILLGDMTSPTTSQKLGNASKMLPYSVLIDANGRILATHAGALSPSQLEQWLGPDRGDH